jgi:hypothetical protein
MPKFRQWNPGPKALRPCRRLRHHRRQGQQDLFESRSFATNTAVPFLVSNRESIFAWQDFISSSSDSDWMRGCPKSLALRRHRIVLLVWLAVVFNYTSNLLVWWNPSDCKALLCKLIWWNVCEITKDGDMQNQSWGNGDAERNEMDSWSRLQCYGTKFWYGWPSVSTPFYCVFIIRLAAYSQRNNVLHETPGDVESQQLNLWKIICICLKQ